ncbi:hypothetical protein ACLOJK_025044 [Asimina triloba]
MHEEVEDIPSGTSDSPTKTEGSSVTKDIKEDEHQAVSKDDERMMEPKVDNDRMETDVNGADEKATKKDRILPCPRCNSMDTKFCYYNNYNVNQPRHFCKNCQRYWTAGGTMRNVPVGAGRRKHKHVGVASHYRQIVMQSDGFPTNETDVPDCGMLAPIGTLEGNGTVLNFGMDNPLSESMATVLNLGDQKAKVELSAVACGGNGEEPSGESSVTAPASSGNKLPENAIHLEQRGVKCFSNGLPPMHQLPCYPVPPWVYSWSPTWHNITAMPVGRCSSELVYSSEGSNANTTQCRSPPMVAAPAFRATSIPFPFVSAPYWGCMPGWVGGAWSVPWVGSNGNRSSSSSSNSQCSGNGSPNLGKHSRDANLRGGEDEKPEKCFWVPKTLRIDDPDKAVKSCTWANLGIKENKNEPIRKGGIFKTFQPKMDRKGTACKSGCFIPLSVFPRKHIKRIILESSFSFDWAKHMGAVFNPLILIWQHLCDCFREWASQPVFKQLIDAC